MTNIILLEDDRELREEVADFLRGQGHEVREAGSKREFRTFQAEQPCEIAILDRRLPDGDGMNLIAEGHAAAWRCGFILVTARDAFRDRIEGYDVGADHYLTKPVRLDELAVILKSLARRLRLVPHWRLNLTLGLLHTPNGIRVELTGLEAAFLAVLGVHPNQPQDRRQLVLELGKDYRSYDSRNLDALLKRLRKKVRNASGLELPVQTRHGLGYMLVGLLRREGD
ncbi:MAG: response regulator transcription factor [Chromatiaceae bacterium]|jgi:two-component system OmpR family response regulator|nr:response regulator transcription factor [Chromatiaceae bacterium]MBP8289288.1 response regulator transcription factor [Chromatiaceae bacterium]